MGSCSCWKESQEPAVVIERSKLLVLLEYIVRRLVCALFPLSSPSSAGFECCSTGGG